MVLEIHTVMIAPAYMNGHRAPFSGPSESQPHDNAMTMKIAVFGRGTIEVLALNKKERVSSYLHTIVDLWHCVMSTGYRRRMSIETLQPVSHACLWGTIIPHDVQESFCKSVRHRDL